MRGYTDDIKKMQQHMELYDGQYKVDIVSIADLRADIPGRGIITLDQTPHYQYIIGNKYPYLNLLLAQNYPYHQSIDSFEYVINNNLYYLDKPHERDFIFCYTTRVIIDGVHRASYLFYLGVKQVPVILAE
jgi:hypothetical protein